MTNAVHRARPAHDARQHARAGRTTRSIDVPNYAAYTEVPSFPGRAIDAQGTSL
jgi:hypothetical protein